jgi:hypothetical protein
MTTPCDHALDRLASAMAWDPDWNDVLQRVRAKRRRGGRRRSRIGLIALAVLTLSLVLLLAGPALGFFGAEPTPSWTWPEGVPGEPIRAPEFVRSVNATGSPRFARVDLDTVRKVSAAGVLNEGYEFLAARGLDGGVCLARVGMTGSRASSMSPFGCLGDAGPSGLHIETEAVLIGSTAGGHRGSAVDYSILVGVARADVGRVELQLVNGDTIRLPLNQWRGFG